MDVPRTINGRLYMHVHASEGKKSAPSYSAFREPKRNLNIDPASWKVHQSPMETSDSRGITHVRVQYCGRNQKHALTDGAQSSRSSRGSSAAAEHGRSKHAFRLCRGDERLCDRPALIAAMPWTCRRGDGTPAVDPRGIRLQGDTMSSSEMTGRQRCCPYLKS